MTVFDKDRFTVDDKMGEADIDIQAYIASLKMGLQNLPNGCVVSRVKPNRNNCLADESCIVWDNGKILQDMILRLRNVESGELVIQIEWINVPGCRGLDIGGKISNNQVDEIENRVSCMEIGDGNDEGALADSMPGIGSSKRG
ncbi:hypothetical protein SADUNF_Sadunf10G0082700 [Salix dunnii]|uniref:C2 domain-containing protein n=1 Tax=Salix dunnii TaxID=1413687 RepID=A0A835JSU8_9ROSI|nr:hypothetical protein SADUNF_Sadunf10G0082700 [Salix dunnii]